MEMDSDALKGLRVQGDNGSKRAESEFPEEVGTHLEACQDLEKWEQQHAAQGSSCLRA